MASAFPDTPVTLIAKLAANLTCRSDERAWVRLFDLYEPAIRRFAEFQGAGEASEDVVQDIFLKLVDVLREGKFSGDEGSFRSYLATLIRHELIGRWRKRAVRGGDATLSMDDPDAGVEVAVPESVSAEIDAKWRLARHDAAVEHALTRTALSKKSVAVYRAYVLEERPLEEVMREFGLPRNGVYQVKTRVEKMIAALERELEQ